MKTNFLKMMILPVAAFILASAGALTTHSAKVAEAKNPPLLAFAHTSIPGECLYRNVNCSTTFSTNPCMSSDAIPQPVWLKNGSQKCVIDLYRP